MLLPHLRDRPFTIKRHYTVPRGPFVWEKDAPAEMPEWIRVAPMPAKSRRGAPVRYPLVNDEAALLWMVEAEDLDPLAFTLDVVRGRIDRFGDLAAPILNSRQRLDKALSGAWLY